MTNILCSFLDWLAGVIVAHIPVIGSGIGMIENMTAAVAKLGEYVGKLNWLIPVTDIMLILGIYCTIRLTKIVLFCVNWVIRRIADIIP